jgi:hypothetical protein
MAKLTITEAIKQSGISRTHFYGHYINKGLISVSEENGKKFIDSSELLRVFPNLKALNTVDTEKQTELNAPEHHEIIQAVQAEQIKHLKEQLADAKDREQEQQERERFYRDQIRLLEAPKSRSNPITRWWNGLGSKDEN